MTTTEMSSGSFLSSDEPDSINFHDSLRFFRQQLSINGNNYPTPSFQITNDVSASKHSEKFLHSYSDDDISDYGSVVVDERSKSANSCRISIPTVDSILESVRVLRAIQKSQRGKGVSSVDHRNIAQNLVPLEEIQEKDSENTSRVGDLFFEADEILNSLQTSDSRDTFENNFSKEIAMEDFLNISNEKSNFWPQHTVKTQDITCNSESGDTFENNHLSNCNFEYTSNTISQTNDVLSNQVEHALRDITENDNLSKSFIDKVSCAEQKPELVSNKLNGSIPDNNIDLVKTMNIGILDATDSPLNVIQVLGLNGLQAECVPTLAVTSQKENQLNEMNNVEDQSRTNVQNADRKFNFDLLLEHTTSEFLCDLSEGYSGSAYPNQLLEEESKPQSGGKERVFSDELSTLQSHPFPKSENNIEIHTTSRQTEERCPTTAESVENNKQIRCKPTNRVEQSSIKGGDVERIHREVAVADQMSSLIKEQINGVDEHVEDFGLTDLNSTDSEKPSQILSSSLEVAQISLNLKDERDMNSEVAGHVQSEVHLKGNNRLPLRAKKLTTSSWDLVSIVKLLFAIEEVQPPKILDEEHNLERGVFIQSKGAFSQFSEGYYTILFEERTLFVLDEKGIFFVLPFTYLEIRRESELTLVLDNKVGKCLHLRCESQEELQALDNELHLCHLRTPDCIHLVRYPLKCHQNVVIIDLGSCSTRAGILMDQPTLPTLFFPSVCAVNKITGQHVYGEEALEPKERQNATISFPLRPSAKIIKHSVDVDQVTGIFEKIFQDLRIDPTNYAALVCLPRSLSKNVQNAIVNVLLKELNVKAVSLSHQAILTMYAHNVSTGIVLDIGDRMDILPVIDGFIVEGGVTRLPHGGQRLIHHMKHALAQKHISLSNDIDSFVVQYISEKLSYVAEDYEMEASLPPEVVRKAVDLTSFARDESCLKSAVLDDARFKVPEGLFQPDLWGLDSPGVHHLVQRAIQAAGVDARKRVAENIYLSGGVTLIPGFVERLTREVAKFNEPRITPKVYASSHRYHCTFIGACKLASMDAFPQVCLTQEEYSGNPGESLKKFLLCV